ncbi:MAG: PAS domain S-box protein [Desulfuromonadales bacterium]
MAHSPVIKMTAGRFKTIMVIGILVLNLFVIGISWVSVARSRHQYTEKAVVTAQNLAEVLEQNITGIINKVDIGILALVHETEEQIAAGGIDEKKLVAYMTSTQSNLPELEGFRVANAKGEVLYGLKTVSGHPASASDRDYFIRLRDNPREQLVVSKPIKGRIIGKWIIILARRLNNPDGTFAGVAFASLPLEKIERLFSSINVGKYGAFALRDAVDLGLVARYPEPGETGSAIGHKKMSQEFMTLLNKGKTSGVYDAPSGLDKRMRTWGFHKFGNNLYYIFVGFAKDEYLAEWRSETIKTGIFLGLFALLSIMVARAAFKGWKRNRAAEASQRASDEQIRLFFERQIVGMAISTPDKHWVQMNDKWCSILGYERDELQSIPWDKLTYPDDLPENIDLFNQLVTGKRDDYSITKRFIRRDGAIVVVDLSVGCVRNEDGTINCLLSLMEDITERKQSERLLRESEERLTGFIRNAPVILFVLDMSGHLTFSDGRGLASLGLKPGQIVGLSAFEIYRDSPSALDGIRRALAGETLNVETVVGDKTFEVWYNPIVNSSGEQTGSIGVATDITERKRAEEERRKLEQQLLHAQKLESLGVLAGGIAHDFNNILMAIMGNADLALMRINHESPAIENLRQIERAAAQAADLAKQMLAYSGKGRFVVENLDLGRLLEEMLHMLEVSITKKAMLRFNLHPNLPPVEADATQMRQIIMNLVINASEAIGDKSGVIAITTGCMDCDKSYLKDVWLDENIGEGLYVYLEIADTGCGMDKDTLARIFDPFFTTKFTGRGLGMAAVLGIVRGHKGAIKVYSEPEKGTSFKVLLPASAKPSEIFNVNSHSDGWRGNGSVLLVDDEETVRGVGREMLQELGFSTITACDGQEAVEVFKATPGITFVILDLTMPHMDGEQCFRELRQLNPDVKVIMSSGYNEQEVTQKFVGKGLAGFIQKPYRLSVLRDAIRNIVT